MRRRRRHLARQAVASAEQRMMMMRAGPGLRLPVEPQQAGQPRQLLAAQAQLLQLQRVA